MLKLEALNAKRGDCLLLYFDDPQRPKLILFDGGPSGVYRRTLEPRLEQLRSDVYDGVVPIELAMVSHIDTDHIKGLVDMTNAMVERAEDHLEQRYDIMRFWHNSFARITGGVRSAAFESMANEASLAGSESRMPDFTFDDERADAIVESVREGEQLSNNLHTLGLGDNFGFDGNVRAGEIVSLPGDLSLHVVAPSQERLDDLRDKWQREMPDAEEAETQAFVDRSIPNLSSIVVVVEYEGKKLLMTGDARGDDILEGLEAGGFLNGGRMHVDVLKVPHHGSDRNVTRGFFSRVTADVYVFSADGSHENPDIETLEMIERARGDASYRLVFTTKLRFDDLQRRLERQLDDMARRPGVTSEFRDNDELGVSIELIA